MFNKVYEKIKEILKENYKSLLIFLSIFLLFTIKLPYYINTPGGFVDVNKRVVIEDGFESEGSLNMAFVTELKATIPTLIISMFNKDWDVFKEEEIVYENETEKDLYYREKLMLEESTNNAIIVGFTKANKNVSIVSTKLFVTYIDENAETDLKIGDEIIEIDGKSIKNTSELSEILKNKKPNAKISLKVISDNKEKIKTATLKEKEGKPIIGILISEKKEIETNPKLELKFKKSESGPSGGLMTALSIYNYLTEEDITKGKLIVGTGTIDARCNVGQIGGVKYKLKGAVKKKAPIFIVPKGKNYEEAIELKERYGYKIKIIGVSTFDEALEALNNL